VDILLKNDQINRTVFDRKSQLPKIIKHWIQRLLPF